MMQSLPSPPSAPARTSLIQDHSSRRRGAPFGALSLGCLRLAAPHETAAEWMRNYERLCRDHGEPAVSARLNELQRNGYITIGLPHVGFLTTKGREALRRAF